MPIATSYVVEVFTPINENCPYEQWFEQLEVKDQFVVETRLHRVRLGAFGEINSIGGGVWELKFRKGRALRIYYVLKDRKTVLLLLGGDKGSQRKDIVKAKTLYSLFLQEG